MKIKIIFTFALRLIGVLSLLTMNLMVAKYLEAYEAGLFFIAFNFLFLVAPFSSLGLEIINLRLISAYNCTKKWGQLKGAISISYILLVASSGLLSIILFESSEWISTTIFNNDELTPLLKVASCSIVLFSLTKLIAHQYQALSYPLVSVTLLTILLPLGITLSILLKNNPNARILITSVPITLFITIFFSIPFLYKTLPKAKIDLATFYEIKYNLISFWVVASLTPIMRWSSSLIAGVWTTPEEVALFNVAQRLAAMVGFILIIINLIIAPKFSALHTQERHIDLERITLKSTRIITLFALPFALILVTLPEIALSFFGEDYKNASPILIILVIGQLLSVSVGPVGYLLMMTGHEKEMKKTLIFSSILMIVFSMIFTSFLGVIGTAIGLALGLTIQSLTSAWFVHKRLGINTLLAWK